jgi:hypothetical protein
LEKTSSGKSAQECPQLARHPKVNHTRRLGKTPKKKTPAGNLTKHLALSSYTKISLSTETMSWTKHSKAV